MMTNSFHISPAHFSYVVADLKEPVSFLLKILELNILRHVEPSIDEESRKSVGLNEGWSKTVFGVGTKADSFNLQLLHFNDESPCDLANDRIVISLLSLPAIARSKVFDYPTVSSTDETYEIRSPEGRIFHLVDATHSHSDAFSEIILETNRVEETYRFWTEFLDVAVVSKCDEEFTLFFHNQETRIKYVTSRRETSPISSHLGFVVSKDGLDDVSFLTDEFEVEVVRQLSRVSSEGRNGDHLLVLKDPNGYLLYFYDRESYLIRSKYDPLAEAKWNLSINGQS